MTWQARSARPYKRVLVLAGKREVPESIFVEPTTARKFPLDASPYQGLECVWNSANYWAGRCVLTG